MASESPVTDQSIHELAGDEKVDVAEEKGKHEEEHASFCDINRKVEEHEQVVETNISFQESQVSNSSELERNDGKSNDVVEIFTSTGLVNSKLEQDDLKFSEVTSPVSEDKGNSEGEPLIFTVEAVTRDTSEGPEHDVSTSTMDSIKIPVESLQIEPSCAAHKLDGSVETEVDVELIKSEDSKEEIQDLVSKKVSSNASKIPEKNDVDSSILTTIEAPVKLETESGYPEEEQKSEESEETKVDIKLVKLGDSKDDGQELVRGKITTYDSEEQEKKVVDSSTLTIEVPAKDFGVESVSTEEQKLEETVAINEPSLNATTTGGGGGKVSGSYSFEEKSSDVSDEFEKKDEGVKNEVIQTTTKLLEDSEARREVDQSQSDLVEMIEKKDEGFQGEVIQIITKLPGNLETKIEVDRTGSDEDKVSVGYSDKEKNGVVEGGIETSTVLDIIPPITEVLFADEKVSELERNVSEGDNSPDKEKDVSVEVIDRGLTETFVDPIVLEGYTEQVQSPEKLEEPLKVISSKKLDVSPEICEVPSAGDKKNEILNAEDSTLEVEFGSSGEQKSEEIAETKESSSNETTTYGVGEVIESSSYEEKFSGAGEVVAIMNEHLKEPMLQTTTNLPIDFKAGSELDQIRSIEENDSKGVALKEEDSIIEGDLETSTIPSVVSLVAKVSSDDEKVADPSEVVQEWKDKISEVDDIVSLPNVSEVTLEGNSLEKDNVVDKEKYVNVDAMDRGLTEAPIDPIIHEVSTGQVQAPENGEESLEVTSKEPNISYETSEVPSSEERAFAGYEKSESLQGEDSSFVEPPKDIITSVESLDRLIEAKNGSTKSETKAAVELSAEAVKEITTTSQTYEENDEASKDISLEKKVNIAEDKDKGEVEEIIKNVTDKPEYEELGNEKNKNNNSKNQVPVVSSATGDVKLVKETSRRESNIFSKIKRSIIKAKKAILGKSPSSKTVIKSKSEYI